MRGVLNNPIFDGTNRHARHTTKQVAVRGSPETHESFKIWAGEEKTRPQSAHLLYNALWGPNAAPGVASKLGQYFDAIRGDDAGGAGAAGRAGGPAGAGVTAENSENGENAAANAAANAELDRRCEELTRQRTSRLQADLDRAITRCSILEDQLQAREAALELLQPFAPPPAQTSTIIDMQSPYQRRSRLGLVKGLIDRVIRTHALCEPMEFWNLWFRTKKGGPELAEHAATVKRWNGHKSAPLTQLISDVAYAKGQKDFRASLVQVKFRTLYVADLCDLSDRAHTVMLRVTGLQRILAGRSGVQEARAIVNQQVHGMLSLQPTPGPCGDEGLGWQAQIEQTIKFILAQHERETACFGPLATLPDTLQFRITYDGAEVGGWPGIIAYLIPMNLGHDVESARAAYPILFVRCKENQENLKAEFKEVADAIRRTRDGPGLTYNGRQHTVDWWQSMDLASFWKQHGLTFNCNAGYCTHCPATWKDDHDFGRWGGEEYENWEGRGEGVLPIPTCKSCFCVTHAKMRVVEKLMKLLAAEAVANDTVKHWVAIVRALGIPAFKVVEQDEDGNKHAPTCSALIGPNCDLLLDNYEMVVRETGVSNYERASECYRRSGHGDPNSKTGPHLKACLKAASVPFTQSWGVAKLLDLFKENIGEHVCSGECEMSGDEVSGKCLVSGYTYSKTNDLCYLCVVYSSN
jgi:hypothetical protein